MKIWKTCLLQFLKENMCGNYTMQSKVWKNLQNFFNEVAFDGRKFGEVGTTSFRKTFQRWIVSTFVRQWQYCTKIHCSTTLISTMSLSSTIKFCKIIQICTISKFSKAFYTRWHLKKKTYEKNEYVFEMKWNLNVIFPFKKLILK
jgi:hypothetical protein